MNEKRFLGVRIEPQVYDLVNKVAEDRMIDRTSAIKILIVAGWRELKLEEALKKYREGLVSLDKAAEIAGLTVNEMMQEASAHGIKTEETLEEYRKGVELLCS